jgi:hypothetical protein
MMPLIQLDLEAIALGEQRSILRCEIMDYL